MRRLALGIVGAVCIASYASAAPPSPVYSWTGFYIGGHVGALWTKGDARNDPLPTVDFFGTFPNSGNVDQTAFVAGVHGGYNWQLSPSWVTGIEADWSWTGAAGRFTQDWESIPGHTNPGIRPGTATSMSMGPEWLATVRGRIGYLVTPSALLYFTGGGAWADVRYSAIAANERPVTYLAATSFSKTASGYVLGGGLEWALWNNWSLRTEYLFYHLNTGTAVNAFNIVPGLDPSLGSGFSWSDTDIHTVRFGASLRF
jgi:outer membrane immunogenic protein